MRGKPTLFVLLVVGAIILLLSGQSVRAQDWATVPTGAFSFDGSDGQEHHFDVGSINQKSCIRVTVDLTVIPKQENKPELMFALQQGGGRYGFNLLSQYPSKTGEWVFQFPVMATRVIDPGSGALGNAIPDGSQGFSDLIFRGWGGVEGTVTVVQVTNGENCDVYSYATETPSSVATLKPCLMADTRMVGNIPYFTGDLESTPTYVFVMDNGLLTEMTVALKQYDAGTGLTGISVIFNSDQNGLPGGTAWVLHTC